ncbi:transposase [Streptomyces sp. R39]|uniref:Mutator family transposase n=1 Tax=Streptomyces sp. R39 TaxID=3238631 RepID=A0AB39QYJ6_9ACTN
MRLASSDRTRIVHLIRDIARQDRDKAAEDLRRLCTAPSEAAATERFLGLSGKWGTQYPAVIRLWSAVWAEKVPVFFIVEIREVVRSTDVIESVNTRARKAVWAGATSRPSTPRRVCLALMGPDPTGGGRPRDTTSNIVCILVQGLPRTGSLLPDRCCADRTPDQDEACAADGSVW